MRIVGLDIHRVFAEVVMLDEDKIIRTATESSKVNKALQKFTVDSRIGGSITDNPRLVQKVVASSPGANRLQPQA